MPRGHAGFRHRAVVGRSVLSIDAAAVQEAQGTPKRPRRCTDSFESEQFDDDQTINWWEQAAPRQRQ